MNDVKCRIVWISKVNTLIKPQKRNFRKRIEENYIYGVNYVIDVRIGSFIAIPDHNYTLCIKRGRWSNFIKC